MIAFDEELLRAGVGVVEQQKAISGQAVSTGATYFLIISFDRSGKMIVNNEADIAFVDTHAERIGGNDRLHSAGHEAVLSAGPFTLAHPAVIRFNAETGHL